MRFTEAIIELVLLVSLLVLVAEANSEDELQPHRILINEELLADLNEQRRIMELIANGTEVRLEFFGAQKLDEEHRCKDDRLLLEQLQRNYSDQLETLAFLQLCYSRNEQHCARLNRMDSRRALDSHMKALLDSRQAENKREDETWCNFDQMVNVLAVQFKEWISKHTPLWRTRYHQLELTKLIKECQQLTSTEVESRRLGSWGRQHDHQDTGPMSLSYKFCQTLTSSEENFSTLIDAKWSSIGGADKLLGLFKYIGFVPQAYDLTTTFVRSPTRNNYVRGFAKLVKSSLRSKRLGCIRSKLLATEARRLEQTCRSVARAFGGHLWLLSVGYETPELTERRAKILRLAQVCKSLNDVELANEAIKRYQATRCLPL